MRRRGKFNILFFVLFLVALLFLFLAIYSSNLFERNSPKLSLKDEIFWNTKTPISLQISDDTGLKSAQIYLVDDDGSQTLLHSADFNGEKDISLNFTFPKSSAFANKTSYKLKISATDISKWNFFTGNTTTNLVNVKIDAKRPVVQVISQSYKITKGGAAVVIFQARDENLNEIYLKTNFGKTFKATPFLKDGYYASLVAWPNTKESFNLTIVASDLAQNVTNLPVNYFTQDRKYKISKLSLNDKFIDGKISELVNVYAKNPDSLDRVGKFKFVNETLRNANEDVINEITSKIPEEMIENFALEPFYPLKNGAAVASYGDHRFYTYEGSEISQSWHLGLDLASVAEADIVANNKASVVYNKENGIYGLNLILYHGFGLYTLYGHCSSVNFNTGDVVKKGDVIAKTGISGLALGDHLHFGVLVQGVEVRPEEWMDRKWLKDNIFSVINSAKKLIEKR